KEHEDGSSTHVQSSFSRSEFWADILAEDRDTFDLDFQRSLPLGERHSLMYGLGYRLTRSETRGSSTLYFTPDSRTDDLVSAFVQDEFQVSDDLKFTFGTKIEHNDYTGFEVQPSARFSLARGENSTLWGAVSRAVRTPSQISEDLSFLQGVLANTPPGFNTLIELVGSDAFESEELIAYELGYRTRPTENSSLDIAAFVHTYDNLSTWEFGTATFMGGGIIHQPVFFANLSEGVGYGAEIAGQVNVSKDWSLHASYSLLLMDLDTDASSTGIDPESAEDEAPRNQLHLRAYHDLADDFELDLALWYVDNLGRAIDSYTRADVRLGWQPTEGSRISLGVQGLFHDDEVEFARGEFGDYYGNELGVYLQLDLSF
ncbi:MAG: TonB-dependent receptor, partial [Planctomycetota bacterium]|nr:TonB-dependent receptor [Planctomycetota bacterium]